MAGKNNKEINVCWELWSQKAGGLYNSDLQLQVVVYYRLAVLVYVLMYIVLITK